MSRNNDEHDENQSNTFSMEKIFGIATLGALTSVGLYFLYQNLSEETRRTVRDSLVSGFKAAVRKDY